MHSNMRDFKSEYVFVEYPKWVTLANGERLLVNDEDEEAAAVGEDTSDERAALFAEAQALGLTPHHRAGVAKLAEMIKAAKG